MSAAIIEALVHLVTLLVAERNAPPEEGGWIRSRNTAYRPPKPQTPPEDTQTEKVAQIGSIGIGKGNNHPGQNLCTICGASGVNKRTCISRDGDKKHRKPITRNPFYLNRGL